MTLQFLGRQPIFDKDLNVVAYELLHRTPQPPQPQSFDGDEATSRLLLNSIECGFEKLVGNKTAFVNATRNHLLGGGLSALPAQKVVLEVLEDVRVDAELIQAVSELADADYTIALDDFRYERALIPLISIADIIKFDVRESSLDEIMSDMRRVLKHNPRLKLLAEKVETHEEYARFTALGFDYFQGYFFSRPDLLRTETLHANGTILLQLMHRVYEPDTDIEQLSSLISRDVALSHKVLCFVNSAACGLPRAISSIREAVTFLGLARIRNWSTMIAMARLEGPPDALLNITLIRARFCELLAQEVGDPDRESFFTVGLFSTIDALLHAEREAILDSLPLSEGIRAGLSGHENTYGRALKLAMGLEAGLGTAPGYQGLDIERILDRYLEATQWADQVLNQVDP